MIEVYALAGGLASVSGIVVGLVGIVGTTRPPRPPSRLARLLRSWWTGQGRSRRQRRTRQAVLLVSAVAGLLVWVVSGWPVGGLIVAVAIPGIPWLFASGAAEQRAIAQLGAIEAWTRRLADIVANGIGLQAAIVATAATTPARIAPEVRDLAARLQAGVPADTALRRFADDIDDYTCDQVVAPLILHVADRGEGLATVLTDISRSIAAEVDMRATVNAKRASPRFAVRFLTGMTVLVLAFGVIDPAYLAPYGSPLGQVVLLALAGTYVVLMLWVRSLSLPERLPRLLPAASTPTPAVAAPSSAAGSALAGVGLSTDAGLPGEAL